MVKNGYCRNGGLHFALDLGVSFLGIPNLLKFVKKILLVTIWRDQEKCVSCFNVYRFLGSLFFLMGCYWKRELSFVLRFGLNTVHTPLLRFLYILVSYTIVVSPGQSSDWYRKFANCWQGDISCDYLWIALWATNLLQRGSTHQQCLSKSQGHPFYIFQDSSGICEIFGKHYWRPHQQ